MCTLWPRYYLTCESWVPPWCWYSYHNNRLICMITAGTTLLESSFIEYHSAPCDDMTTTTKPGWYNYCYEMIGTLPQFLDSTSTFPVIQLPLGSLAVLVPLFRFHTTKEHELAWQLNPVATHHSSFEPCFVHWHSNCDVFLGKAGSSVDDISWQTIPY